MQPNELWDTEGDFIWEMLTSGAAVRIERDEENDLVISWDMPVLKAKYPHVHAAMTEAHLEEVTETLEQMVEDGLLEREPIIHPDGELDTAYELTDLGREILSEFSGGLDGLE